MYRLKHSSSDETYELNLNSSKCSKLLNTIIHTDKDATKNAIEIPIGSYRAFKIIIKYLDLQRHGEKRAKKNLHELNFDLKSFFDHEKCVFKDIYENRHDPDCLEILSELFLIADYMNMNIFIEKLQNLYILILSDPT